MQTKSQRLDTERLSPDAQLLNSCIDTGRRGQWNQTSILIHPRCDRSCMRTCTSSTSLPIRKKCPHTTANWSEAQCHPTTPPGCKLKPTPTTNSNNGHQHNPASNLQTFGIAQSLARLLAHPAVLVHQSSGPTRQVTKQLGTLSRLGLWTKHLGPAPRTVPGRSQDGLRTVHGWSPDGPRMVHGRTPDCMQIVPDGPRTVLGRSPRGEWGE